MEVEIIDTLNIGLQQFLLNFNMTRITWKTLKSTLPGDYVFFMPGVEPENLHFSGILLASGSADAASLWTIF